MMKATTIYDDGNVVQSNENRLELFGPNQIFNHDERSPGAAATVSTGNIAISSDGTSTDRKNIIQSEERNPLKWKIMHCDWLQRTTRDHRQICRGVLAWDSSHSSDLIGYIYLDL
jgi:hypothetical protein